MSCIKSYAITTLKISVIFKIFFKKFCKKILNQGIIFECRISCISSFDSFEPKLMASNIKILFEMSSSQVPGLKVFFKTEFLEWLKFSKAPKHEIS